MEFGGLDNDVLSKQEPRKFFNENLYESIPYESQRKHVVDVMAWFQKRRIHFIDWKSREIELPSLVGTNWESTFKKSRIIGDIDLFLTGYNPDIFLQPELDVGLSYFLQLGQRAYDYAYKAGRKLKGSIADVVLYDEMADNFKNLVRAIFEFKIRFLPPDKELSEKVLREMDAALYHGNLPQLYQILHGRSFEKPPTLH